MGKETGMKETVDNVLDDIAAKRAAASEKAGQENRETSPKKEFKEITMKFGKGCVGEEFQGKDGNKYKEILVPNPDKNDHRPWQTFVVKANHVHEDKFGKGMWIKLPAEGHTTLRRPVVVGEKPDGKVLLFSDGFWSREDTKILKQWKNCLPPDTFRIVKTGADANPQLKGLDVFVAEDLFAVLDAWLEEGST